MLIGLYMKFAIEKIGNNAPNTTQQTPNQKQPKQTNNPPGRKKKNGFFDFLLLLTKHILQSNKRSTDTTENFKNAT